MKLTKYAHACFVVENESASLVVDPGGWSTDFVTPSNVAGVIITHEHPDHLDVEKLEEIIAANPDVIIYAAASVVAKIPQLPTEIVNINENVYVGKFALEFVGGTHATIHESYPQITNLGVVIDETLYYPGDSFTLPSEPIQTLLVPASAPWSKISETIDFITELEPTHVVPTHDAILSPIGTDLYDRLLSGATEKTGGTYRRLNSGESLEL